MSTKPLHAIAAVLIFLAPLVRAADLAPHVEIGAGATHYAIGPNGIWYQVGAVGNRVQTRSTAWLVGVTGDLFASDLSGISYHADYVDLGHIRSTCLCTSVDDDYSAATHQVMRGAPLARFVGTGAVRGIKLSLAPYLTVGTMRVGAEAGVLVYADYWRETVYGWGNGMGLVPRDVWMQAHKHLHAAAVIGLYLTRGHFTVAYEQTQFPNHLTQRIPPLYASSGTLMVTYSF